MTKVVSNVHKQTDSVHNIGGSLIRDIAKKGPVSVKTEVKSLPDANIKHATSALATYTCITDSLSYVLAQMITLARR